MRGMAEEQEDASSGPSLEPPRLFGRKKKPATPVEAPAPEPPPQPVAAPTPEPAPQPAPEPAPEPVAQPAPEPQPTVVLPPTPAPVAEAPVAPEAPEVPAGPAEPWASGRTAALVAGLVAGALIVAATAASLRACTAIRGTATCGGGAGFGLLVVILLVAVLVGSAVLRSAQVPGPGSTSFLAVGLVSVVALLFLVGHLLAWWMVIVIPVLSVLAYLGSHWVTTTYVDDETT
jgi:hypothetical protein